MGFEATLRSGLELIAEDQALCPSRVKLVAELSSEEREHRLSGPHNRSAHVLRPKK